MESLLAMAQILDQTLTRLRQSTQVRTLIEVALIRLCNLQDLEALPDLIARLLDPSAALASGPVAPSPSVNRPPVPSPSTSTRAAAQPPLPPPPEQNPPQKKTLNASSAPPAKAESLAAEPQSDLENPQAIWQQTLSAIGDMTSVNAAKADRVATSGPNRLVVAFRKAYTVAQQYCDRPEQRQRLEQTFSKLAGRNIRIDFAILPDDGASPAASPVPAKQPSRRQRHQEMQRHPLIRKASELFDTEIVDLREPVASEELASNPAPETQ
jgi:DNA polymerase-3 subunit gamma/tau